MYINDNYAPRLQKGCTSKIRLARPADKRISVTDARHITIDNILSFIFYFIAPKFYFVRIKKIVVLRLFVNRRPTFMVKQRILHIRELLNDKTTTVNIQYPFKDISVKLPVFNQITRLGNNHRFHENKRRYMGVLWLRWELPQLPESYSYPYSTTIRLPTTTN